MKRVLFVDTYVLLAKVSCEVLRLHGYDAECAFSAEDALHLLDSKTFDVIVVDVELADLPGRIRESFPSATVILLAKNLSQVRKATGTVIQKQLLFPALIEAIDQAGLVKPSTYSAVAG